ncbi:MAG TPA: sigma factor-like helix-turn-helix DNA-binding protein [Myxococcota bacterium]|nr:sigma factor-like helix-turn-helix DNA-binding protein [Myxococcota bacterium]
MNNRGASLTGEHEKRRGRRRSKTIARKQMMRERKTMSIDPELLRLAEQERPRTRRECLQKGRPCLFVSCKHHLYLDVNPDTGSIKLNFPDKEVWELRETCALDVAGRGGLTLEEVGEILNLTRERIRQVEAAGLKKLLENNDEQELKDLLA